MCINDWTVYIQDDWSFKATDGIIGNDGSWDGISKFVQFFFLDGRIKGGIPLAIHLVARLRSANFGESSIGIFEQG